MFLTNQKLGFRNGDFADPAGSMKQITEHYENLGTMNPYIFSKNFGAIDHYNSSQNKIAIDTENLRKNPDDLIKIIADMSTFNRGDGYSYTGAFGQKLGKELGWGKKPIKLSFQVLKSSFSEIQGYLNDWAISVVDSVSELKDSSESMKGFYDDITGTDFLC